MNLFSSQWRGRGRAASSDTGDGSTWVERLTLLARAPHGGPRRTIVEKVSLGIADGEMVALIGRSGSGKTVTARAIAGVLPPGITLAAGRIRRPAGRWAVHTVFQNGHTALDPFSTIQRVIARCLRRAARSPYEPVGGSVDECLRLAGLDPAAFAQRHPFELSGGESRRAALALAFATPARLIVLDEPTAGLDPPLKVELAERLADLRRPGRGVLIVTHAIGLFRGRVDRIHAIHPGVAGAISLPSSAEGAMRTPVAPLFSAASCLESNSHGVIA